MVKKVYQEEKMTIYEAEDLNSTQRNLHIFLGWSCHLSMEWAKSIWINFLQILTHALLFLHFL